MRRPIPLLAFLLAILCIVLAAASVEGQELKHGAIIGKAPAYLAIAIPLTEDRRAIDYVTNQAVGRTVWASGVEWVLLPMGNPCVGGVDGVVVLPTVTVCPPRREGEAMDACLVPEKTGIFPIYDGNPVVVCGAPARRRAVGH